MKFIRDIDGDLVNMDNVDYVFIRDKGEDFPIRFEIIAESKGNEYRIKPYRTEDGARKFLKLIHDKFRFEINE